MKIGDKVNYIPRALDEDPPVSDAEILQYEPAGAIFNQPMAVISGVDHWVPAYDLFPTSE